MPLIINTNIGSINAQRYLTSNTNALQKSMERLSSGFRINRAGDDAAGLQLSENLRAQIRGSQKALDNTQDGINVLNITDGALQTITDNIQRMRELSVQAANDTYSAEQRTAMETEYTQLAEGITQIAESVEFNGMKLLDGASGIEMLQISANTDAGIDDFDVSGLFIDATSATLSIDTVDFSDHDAAIGVIDALDAALTTINTARGEIGASINRLEGTASNLSTMIENLSASESRIRNVDVAAESANLARFQILQQASAAMLAQANSAPQLALQLLRG